MREDSTTPSRITRRLGPAGFDRYDAVLAIIPAVFVAALLAGQLRSLSLRATVAAGSLVCAVVLADALFLDPPRPGNTG